MSHFGPAVIGQEQFDEEQAKVKSLEKVFGPAVLGKNVAGPAVTNAAPTPEPEPEPDEVVESFSVRAVRESLADDPVPTVIDRMVKAEMLRPDGPRKSALTECLRAEKRRDAPREEVVGMLTGAIKELE